MPICRSSGSNVRAPLAFPSLALAALTLASVSALAQDSTPPTDARSRAAEHGAKAMERVKDAAATRQKEAGAKGPTSLPKPSEEMRRRAFDGLRGRVQETEMDARARAALDRGKDAMAAERDAIARRLGQALGLEGPDMDAVAGVVAPPAAKAWVPVLFVSSSMPVTTLRTYAAQLEKARGILAFRGMPGGLTKVAPMAKLSAEILRLDPGCEGPACAMRDVQLIVDPLIFRQHGVARVPALAMVPGDPALPYCEREDDSPRAAHVIYGDAALSGLLEEYARLGGKKEVRDAQARLQGR